MNRFDALQAIRRMSKAEFERRMAGEGLRKQRQDLLYAILHGQINLDSDYQYDVESYGIKCLVPEVCDLLLSELSTRELYEYDPPKNGKNIIKHGVGFAEAVSYSRRFGTLMAVFNDNEGEGRHVIFSDLNLEACGGELALPLSSFKGKSYMMSVVSLRAGRFRFISSRLISSNKNKYRKTMDQALKGMIYSAKERSDFVSRCVEIFERDLIRPDVQVE